jgi:hypothetical protein
MDLRAWSPEDQAPAVGPEDQAPGGHVSGAVIPQAPTSSSVGPTTNPRDSTSEPRRRGHRKPAADEVMAGRMSEFTRASDALPPQRSCGCAMEPLALHSTRFVRQRAAHVVALGACILLGTPTVAGAVMKGNPTPTVGPQPCTLGGKSYESGKTVVVTLADGKTRVTLRCSDGAWQQARPDAATTVQYQADAVYEDASGTLVVTNPQLLSADVAVIAGP